MNAALSVQPVDLRAARRATAQASGDVAAMLGVHPNTLLRWERLERSPAPRHLRGLAAAYDVPLTTISAYFDQARARARTAEEGRTGRGLRRLRMVHRLTASEVALQISVSPHRVYNWEAGRARIPHRFLGPLAEVFSISTDEFEHWLRRGPVRAMPRPGDRNPLRRLRLAAGQSQDQLSRSAGVGLSSLKAWEYGAPPALSAIRGLAQALDLPAQKLALALGLDLPRELVPAAWKPGDLPEVLRVLRLWSRLTQAELASRCDCSAVSVRSWEGGRARPSGRSRERLERLYRLPAGALLWAYPRNPTSASMPAGSLGPARPVRG